VCVCVSLCDGGAKLFFYRASCALTAWPFADSRPEHPFVCCRGHTSFSGRASSPFIPHARPESGSFSHTLFPKRSTSPITLMEQPRARVCYAPFEVSGFLEKLCSNHTWNGTPNITCLRDLPRLVFPCGHNEFASL